MMAVCNKTPLMIRLKHVRTDKTKNDMDDRMIKETSIGRNVTTSVSGKQKIQVVVAGFPSFFLSLGRLPVVSVGASRIKGLPISGPIGLFKRYLVRELSYHGRQRIFLFKLMNEFSSRGSIVIDSIRIGDEDRGHVR